MTTITRAPAEADASAREIGAFAGTATLVRFLLRRDRIKLPAWTGGFGLFVLYLVAALPSIAETEEDLGAATQLFRDPVGRLLVGPAYGMDEPTFARLVAGGYGLYFLLLAAIMSILLVVRHTRAEEQSGRAELVRANVVGRGAPLTATAIVATITNIVAGGVVAVLMVTAGGFPAPGSVLFATGITLTGLAFAGVTMITAQLSEYSRAAAGMAGAVLGIAFALRAAGDMAAVGGNALSWTSPLAWAQQTAPFVLDRWWPLALLLGFAVTTTAIASVLSARRDLGASLVSVRPGRPRAAPWLGTPLGLALRLQRASLLGWLAALVVSGIAFGAYADALLGAVGDMPEAFTELFGEEDLLAGYLAYMAQFMAYLAAAFAILAVQGYRNEETSGRGEPVLATPTSRRAWLGSHLAVTAIGAVVVLALTGVATGLGVALVTGDASHLGELTVAHVNQVPAVWVVLGATTLLYGLVPRAVGAAWVFVGYGLFAGTFAQLMQIPSAVTGLSPFEHPAAVPVEPVAATPLLVLLAIAAATTAVGVMSFRRRDLLTT